MNHSNVNLLHTVVDSGVFMVGEGRDERASAPITSEMT